MAIIGVLRVRGARIRDLLLPLGFLSLLLSFSPQFASYYFLAERLDGDHSMPWGRVMIPNAASWFFMWLSSLVLIVGLRRKVRNFDLGFHLGFTWVWGEFGGCGIRVLRVKSFDMLTTALLVLAKHNKFQPIPYRPNSSNRRSFEERRMTECGTVCVPRHN